MFGVPDDKFGELPTAVYLVKEGKAVSEDALREFLLAHIAPFKVPVRLWQESASLPRLGTEKVDKRALRARYHPIWAAEQAAAA